MFFTFLGFFFSLFLSSPPSGVGERTHRPPILPSVPTTTTPNSITSMVSCHWETPGSREQLHPKSPLNCTISVCILDTCYTSITNRLTAKLCVLCFPYHNRHGIGYSFNRLSSTSAKKWKENSCQPVAPLGRILPQ